MRKILAILAIAALSVPVAHGAGGFGVFGTMWDADDTDDPGIGGGVKFKMEMMPQIMLELRATYLQDFWDTDTGQDEMIMVPLEVAVVVDFPVVPDVLTLFGGAGGGYYIWPEYESDVPIGASLEPDIDPDDELGYFAVGGAELQLNEQMKIFGEAKYNVVEMDGAEIDGEEVPTFGEEADFGGLSFSAGLLLLW